MRWTHCYTFTYNVLNLGSCYMYLCHQLQISNTYKLSYELIESCTQHYYVHNMHTLCAPEQKYNFQQRKCGCEYVSIKQFKQKKKFKRGSFESGPPNL